MKEQVLTEQQIKIINQLKDWSKRHGKTPSVPEWNLSKKQGEDILGSTTIKNAFGSWNKALESANLTFNRVARDTEIIKQQLLEWKKIYGNKAPKKEEWQKAIDEGLELCGRILASHSAIRDKLGNWTDVLEEFGFEDINITIKKTKEEMIEEMRNWIKENGKIPSSTLWRELRKNEKVGFSTATAEREFSSWNSFMSEVLEKDLEKRITTTRAEKIKGLILWGEKYGTIPTKEEWDNLRNTLGIPTVSSVAYSNEFDSWVSVLKQVFGEDNVKRNRISFSDEYILEEVRNWIKKNGREPSRDEWSECKEKGEVTIGATTISKRFDGWRNGVKKALNYSK